MAHRTRGDAAHDAGSPETTAAGVAAANDELTTVPRGSTGSPPAAAPDDPAPAPHHRRRRILLVVGGIVTVLVLAAVYVTFGGQRAQESSEDQARQRLAPTAGTTGTTAVPSLAPLSGTPAPGLYRYRGTGREVTSFPPLAETQGPSMPATVPLSPDGCWVLQIDYNTHHWQNWTYCTVNGELRETHGTTFSRRVLGASNIDNTSNFTCDPPAVIMAAGDRPDTTRPRSCAGSGSLIPAVTTVAGTMTVVGTESIDVGGVEVPTVHVRNDLTYTGGQTGTEKSDNWFTTTTGMPVRNERHITVNTETPFGTITYTENADLHLQTASPV